MMIFFAGMWLEFHKLTVNATKNVAQFPCLVKPAKTCIHTCTHQRHRDCSFCFWNVLNRELQYCNVSVWAGWGSVLMLQRSSFFESRKAKTVLEASVNTGSPLVQDLESQDSALHSTSTLQLSLCPKTKQEKVFRELVWKWACLWQWWQN